MIERGDYWEEQVSVNPAQMAFMLLQAKQKWYRQVVHRGHRGR